MGIGHGDMTLLPTNILSRPWQLDSSKPFDLLGRIVNPEDRVIPKLVLDLGCGVNDSPISKQVRDLPCEELYSVDAWQPYLDIINSIDFAAHEHHFINGSIETVIDKSKIRHKGFDLCLGLDCIEHLPKDVGIRVLRRLPKIARDVLIWIPIGHDPVHSIDDNPFQEHQATWLPEELVDLGYSVRVFFKVHTKSPPVDAAWCWIRGRESKERGLDE